MPLDRDRSCECWERKRGEKESSCSIQALTNFWRLTACMVCMGEEEQFGAKDNKKTKIMVLSTVALVT
ncbi:hypothetical protein QJS04_geneDACA007949 [Acorus gramineus]|uniref:Uncharacterized protein n=1 Tax=Acorus gramineus TaxID=55184 RepID=A0AAV9B9X4_ACOGR|nr:hypothetical protein QJS04_geneDACA007949 [Acorus gramineus]